MEKGGKRSPLPKGAMGKQPVSSSSGSFFSSISSCKSVSPPKTHKTHLKSKAAPPPPPNSSMSLLSTSRLTTHGSRLPLDTPDHLLSANFPTGAMVRTRSAVAPKGSTKPAYRSSSGASKFPAQLSVDEFTSLHRDTSKAKSAVPREGPDTTSSAVQKKGELGVSSKALDAKQLAKRDISSADSQLLRIKSRSEERNRGASGSQGAWPSSDTSCEDDAFIDRSRRQTKSREATATQMKPSVAGNNAPSVGGPDDDSAWTDVGVIKRRSNEASSRASSKASAEPEREMKTAQALREAEASLAKANMRIKELEEKCVYMENQRTEELQRQKSLVKAVYDDQIKKLQEEHLKALENERRQIEERHAAASKRGEQREEEVKKEALARQNSMKQRYEENLKEMRQKVQDLEATLRKKEEGTTRERKKMQEELEVKFKKKSQAQEKECEKYRSEIQKKETEVKECQLKIQSLTSSIQTLTNSLSQMKELSDVSRSALEAMESKSKTNAMYLQNLMKKEEALRGQLATMMPVREAKRLAFRALLKGRAVEMMSRVCMAADANVWNKAWAFQQLVYLIGGGDSAEERRNDAIESRLMQFRKEQMFLMAENERLMTLVSQLQQESINKRQSAVALMDQALGTEAKSMKDLSNSFLQERYSDGLAVRWLVNALRDIINKKTSWAFIRQVDVLYSTYTPLRAVFAIAVLGVSRQRVSNFGVHCRMQKVTTEADSASTVDSLQKRFNEMRVSAYKDMTARIGAIKVASYIRCTQTKLLCSALARLWIHTAATAEEEAKQSLAALRQNQKGSRLQFEQRDPFALNSATTTPNCSSSAFASMERCIHFGTGGRSGLGPDEAMTNLNAPVAHQPFYYRKLPSVRSPMYRNVFVPVSSPAPPIKDYIPHTGYAVGQMSLGVPSVTVGKGTPFEAGILNCFPSGPYDATQSVEERGAVLRMRRQQEDLQKSLSGSTVPTLGANVVASRLPNTHL